MDDGDTNRTPFVTSLPASIPSGTNSVILSTAVPHPGQVQHITSLAVAAMGSGYEFGKVQMFNFGGGPAVKAEGTPGIMTAFSAGSGAAGSGGPASTSCIVIPTGQTAIKGQITRIQVTLTSSGALPTSGYTITAGGQVIAEANLYASGTYTDNVIGLARCSGLTGASVTLSYGVASERLVQGTGTFNATTTPCGTAVSSSSPSDSGIGLTADCNGFYLGTVSYGTDNKTAFLNAVTLMNAAAKTSTPFCIYIPAGNYLTSIVNPAGAFSGAAVGYGSWLGDEHYFSNVFVVPNTAGDVFAWYDSNKNSTQPPFGNTQNFSNYSATATTQQPSYPNNNQAGGSFRNIAIIGNRASTAIQNGLMLYGKTEFLYADNWVVSYLRGCAFCAGFPDSTGNGDFNESRIQNAHLDNDGDTPAPGVLGNTTPTFEITSNSSPSGGDASNVDTIDNVRVFDSWGPGLWITQAGTVGNNTRAINLLNFTAEASGMSNQYVMGDLLEFGSGTLGSFAFNTSDILCRNVQLSNPVTGYAALRIAASSGNAANTSNIGCQGAIIAATMNNGRGLQVDACPFCSFKMASNAAGDYNILLGTIGSLTSTGGCIGSFQGSAPIQYDGNGTEPTLTTCIDPSAVADLRYMDNNNYVAKHDGTLRRIGASRMFYYLQDFAIKALIHENSRRKQDG